MSRFLALICLPFLLTADDRWVEIRSGPFTVLTNAGSRSGQDVMAQVEQLRHTLGVALGKQEMRSVWPIRVVLFKNAKQFEPYAQAGMPRLGRDAIIGALVANAPIPPRWMLECTRLLIDFNAGRMPREVEDGLEKLYSTLQASGSKVSLGAPVPPEDRDLSWARMHLLTTSPEYYGKLRVLLYNLQRGVAPDAAYRNAFGKSAQEIDREAEQHLKSGKFEAVPVSGAPINPRTDFKEAQAEPVTDEIAMADLLLKGPRSAAQARSAYEALATKFPSIPEPLEGLGLLALRDGRQEDARKDLTAAANAGSKNARAWLELARLTPDAALAGKYLAKAAELNPNWAEPHVLMAQRATDSRIKVAELKKAAVLDPRDAALQQALAEAHLARNEYPEAARAWTAAEQASVDEAERARIRQARASIEQQRLDFEAAERKRQAEERERELQKVKDAAMAEVRAAEAKVNKQAAARQPVDALPPEPGTTRITGRMTRVDCLGASVRLTVQEDKGKAVRLLIRDPKSVVVTGGQLDLACGPQRPARAVVVQFAPEANSRTGTAGDIKAIDFP